MNFSWNKQKETGKKNFFVLIWVATILVVVGQILYSKARGTKHEGVIILETRTDGGSQPVVHLARTMGNQYLPSNAKSLNTRRSTPTASTPEQVDQVEGSLQYATDEQDDDAYNSFLVLPASSGQKPTFAGLNAPQETPSIENKDLAVKKPVETSPPTNDATEPAYLFSLPAAQNLRITKAGDFDYVESAKTIDQQIIKAIAVDEQRLGSLEGAKLISDSASLKAIAGKE